jgi:hypothetical protein
MWKQNHMQPLNKRRIALKLEELAEAGGVGLMTSPLVAPSRRSRPSIARSTPS